MFCLSFLWFHVFLGTISSNFTLAFRVMKQTANRFEIVQVNFRDEFNLFRSDFRDEFNLFRSDG